MKEELSVIYSNDTFKNKYDTSVASLGDIYKSMNQSEETKILKKSLSPPNKNPEIIKDRKLKLLMQNPDPELIEKPDYSINTQDEDASNLINKSIYEKIKVDEHQNNQKHLSQEKSKNPHIQNLFIDMARNTPENNTQINVKSLKLANNPPAKKYSHVKSGKINPVKSSYSIKPIVDENTKNHKDKMKDFVLEADKVEINLTEVKKIKSPRNFMTNYQKAYSNNDYINSNNVYNFEPNHGPNHRRLYRDEIGNMNSNNVDHRNFIVIGEGYNGNNKKNKIYRNRNFSANPNKRNYNSNFGFSKNTFKSKNNTNNNFKTNLNKDINTYIDFNDINNTNQVKNPNTAGFGNPQLNEQENYINPNLQLNSSNKQDPSNYYDNSIQEFEKSKHCPESHENRPSSKENRNLLKKVEEFYANTKNLLISSDQNLPSKVTLNDLVKSSVDVEKSLRKFHKNHYIEAQDPSNDSSVISKGNHPRPKSANFMLKNSINKYKKRGPKNFRINMKPDERKKFEEKLELLHIEMRNTMDNLNQINNSSEKFQELTRRWHELTQTIKTLTMNSNNSLNTNFNFDHEFQEMDNIDNFSNNNFYLNENNQDPNLNRYNNDREFQEMENVNNNFTNNIEGIQDPNINPYNTHRKLQENENLNNFYSNEGSQDPNLNPRDNQISQQNFNSPNPNIQTFPNNDKTYDFHNKDQLFRYSNMEFNNNDDNNGQKPYKLSNSKLSSLSNNFGQNSNHIYSNNKNSANTNSANNYTKESIPIYNEVDEVINVLNTQRNKNTSIYPGTTNNNDSNSQKISDGKKTLSLSFNDTNKASSRGFNPNNSKGQNFDPRTLKNFEFSVSNNPETQAENASNMNFYPNSSNRSMNKIGKNSKHSMNHTLRENMPSYNNHKYTNSSNYNNNYNIHQNLYNPGSHQLYNEMNSNDNELNNNYNFDYQTNTGYTSSKDLYPMSQNNNYNKNYDASNWTENHHAENHIGRNQSAKKFFTHSNNKNYRHSPNIIQKQNFNQRKNLLENPSSSKFYENSPHYENQQAFDSPEMMQNEYMDSNFSKNNNSSRNFYPEHSNFDDKLKPIYENYKRFENNSTRNFNPHKSNYSIRDEIFTNNNNKNNHHNNEINMNSGNISSNNFFPDSNNMNSYNEPHNLYNQHDYEENQINPNYDNFNENHPNHYPLQQSHFNNQNMNSKNNFHSTNSYNNHLKNTQAKSSNYQYEINHLSNYNSNIDFSNNLDDANNYHNKMNDLSLRSSHRFNHNQNNQLKHNPKYHNERQENKHIIKEYENKYILNKNGAVFDDRYTSYDIKMPLEYYHSYAKANEPSKDRDWCIRPHHTESTIKNKEVIPDDIMNTKYVSYYSEAEKPEPPPTRLNLLNEVIGGLQENIDTLKKKLHQKAVTEKDFRPIYKKLLSLKEEAKAEFVPGKVFEKVQVKSPKSTDILNSNQAEKKNYSEFFNQNEEIGKTNYIIKTYETLLNELREKEKEKILRKRKEEYEKIRPPVEKWWEMKNKNFQSEFKRNTIVLNSGPEYFKKLQLLQSKNLY